MSVTAYWERVDMYRCAGGLTENMRCEMFGTLASGRDVLSICALAPPVYSPPVYRLGAQVHRVRTAACGRDSFLIVKKNDSSNRNSNNNNNNNNNMTTLRSHFGSSCVAPGLGACVSYR